MQDASRSARLNRTADILARRLHEAGCRIAFGMPGGEVLTLIDALERAGIAFVLVKHETAAGFMAEGVWHMTGAPGIMVATLGPGAMNGVNAVANAHQDRVPLFVLTGCVDADVAETYTHQVLDHRAVFAPITKATYRLTAEAAAVVADKAVRTATAPRAGPVHVDVPISVAAATAADSALPSAVPAPAVPAPGPDLDRARTAVAQAERPIVLAGLDALDGGADALRRFVEVTGAPFVTTYRAKGVLPEDHPLSLGGAGLSPLADTRLLPLFRAADLIVLAGYDPIEMRPGWQDVWDPTVQTVIDIAPEANRHYMHQATLAFQTDLGATLDALAPTDDMRPAWPAGEPAAALAGLAAAFPTDEAWGPGAVIDACRRALPADGIATVDSGAHRILLSQMWQTSAPRTLLQSAGLCTMGCAIPLALGAQIAAPRRKVMAFTGDAGFLMVAGELATAAERALPIVVVVFVDASLALIEKKQRERQLPNEGVDFAAHDFAAVGRALGGRGARVSSRAELDAALAEALGADTFTVIAAHIDRRAYDGRI